MNHPCHNSSRLFVLVVHPHAALRLHRFTQSLTLVFALLAFIKRYDEIESKGSSKGPPICVFLPRNPFKQTVSSDIAATRVGRVMTNPEERSTAVGLKMFTYSMQGKANKFQHQPKPAAILHRNIAVQRTSFSREQVRD